MLKEAIEKIQEMVRAQVYENKERDSFVVIGGKGEIVQYTAKRQAPKALALYSLNGLVTFVKNEATNEFETPLFLSVQDHRIVTCYGKPLSYEESYFRPTYYIAEAKESPVNEFELQGTYDEMQVALMTRFQETPDLPYVLKLLSSITTGAKVTFNNNGVATSVVTTKGVALQSNEMVKPIVKLKPYRTFYEVDQPESPFLLRLNEHGARLIPADGGIWKLKARKTIKEYLEDALAEEIKAGIVAVSL